MSDSDRFVTLRTGPVVPVGCLRLAWHLEDRGCRFALTKAGDLEVSPSRLLTDEDREGLRRWRNHLVMLLHHFETHQTEAHLLPQKRARRQPVMVA